MYTKSARLAGAAAAVSGARHVRSGRNGQDAAAAWVSGGDRDGGGRVVDGGAATDGAIVVCDGCGAGASSEVGARLGAQLVLGALIRRLGQRGAHERAAGPPPIDDAASPTSLAFWAGVRAEVGATLATLLAALPGERARVVHDHFLFTIVAAVVRDDAIAVWALGDGAYAIDGAVRVLGPFADNQPPYLAYDLLGDPQPAHLEVARGASVLVATDGVAEVGLERFAGADMLARCTAHPDALRRQLALLARCDERLDWDARRVVRTPALLQDDGAVALLVRARGGAA